MNLIGKLRRRFILLATLAIFIIVAGALGLINAFGYWTTRTDIMDTLQLISNNNGKMPAHTRPAVERWFPGLVLDDETPEFFYQTRYFSILINADSQVTGVNIKNISAFSEEEAAQAAREAIQSESSSGFFQKNRASYGYMRTDRADGSHLVVVLDCTREFSAVHTFQNYSLWFGLMCILLYVIVFAFLSNRAVAPFIRNLENQKQFITNASHELKTPIAIISVNAEALEMVNGANQWTKGIRKQVTRLSQLINRLILLARASEGSQLVLNKTSFDVPALLKSTTEEFQPLAEGQKKHFVCEDIPPFTIKQDERYVTELLHILSDNAVKYCDDGGTIRLTAAPGKTDHGTISISNDFVNGKDVDYNRFFDRFYREDQSHNSQKAGYGIGLSIAADLAKTLGGKIDVSWADGRITFTMRF
jgi:two-component system sensor histidine kinase CiaH